MTKEELKDFLKFTKDVFEIELTQYWYDIHYGENIDGHREVEDSTIDEIWNEYQYVKSHDKVKDK